MPDFVVAGGGQCGLLLSAGLAQAGATVTLVERLPAAGGQEPESDVASALTGHARVAGVKMLLGSLAVQWHDGRLHTLGVEGARPVPARALVVATGTRPATRGELGIAGDRFAGIFPGSAALHLTEAGVLLGRRPMVVGGGSLAASCVRILRAAGADEITVVAPDGVLDQDVRSADQLLEGWIVEQALGSPRLANVILSCDGAQLRLAADALVLAHRRIPMLNVENAIEPAVDVVFCHSTAEPKSLRDAREIASEAVAETLARSERAPSIAGGM